jgi:hypothetical protein
MSTAYCAVLSELRDDVSREGLNPENGGFFLLAAFPDDVEAEFDVWVIDLKGQTFQGDVLMVNTPIPAHDMQLASTYQMGMAM